jgi:hypothetical protein
MRQNSRPVTHQQPTYGMGCILHNIHCISSQAKRNIFAILLIIKKGGSLVKGIVSRDVVSTKTIDLERL